ncbi:hypothetical protein [Roseomonas fluvialis]|uniref:hypothetical protein n=1 Tax=Roseomonas fluvialis TaxID=1750527 RepID=UPI001FCB5C50|nr:hypothetical protein [Roseomonas fluvialis]
MMTMRQMNVLSVCVAAVLCFATACSGPAQRAVVPMLRGGPSDERPPWLRELPQPIERYPAPQGWGGDNLAAQQFGVGAG